MSYKESMNLFLKYGMLQVQLNLLLPLSCKIIVKVCMAASPNLSRLHFRQEVCLFRLELDQHVELKHISLYGWNIQVSNVSAPSLQIERLDSFLGLF